MAQCVASIVHSPGILPTVESLSFGSVRKSLFFWSIEVFDEDAGEIFKPSNHDIAKSFTEVPEGVN